MRFSQRLKFCNEDLQILIPNSCVNIWSYMSNIFPIETSHFAANGYITLDFLCIFSESYSETVDGFQRADC